MFLHFREISINLSNISVIDWDYHFDELSFDRITRVTMCNGEFFDFHYRRKSDLAFIRDLGIHVGRPKTAGEKAQEIFNKASDEF